jgi:hypothetical protein
MLKNTKITDLICFHASTGSASVPLERTTFLPALS